MWWKCCKKPTIDQRLHTIENKLEAILVVSNLLLKGERVIMASLDDLKANVATLIATVTAEGDVVQAAVLAINGLTGQIATLSQQLADAIALGDPVAIQAAADAIKAQNDLIVSQTAALAAAIPAVPPVV